MQSDRRDFLKTMAVAPAATQAVPKEQAENAAAAPATAAVAPERPVQWPRKFTGQQLAMIAFPLGGVGAGAVSLGGRGQLRDWEIFNRPDKGNHPDYALPSIWVQAKGRKPMARVLESLYLPPYEGADGLGSKNAPGLRRMKDATFTGEFPLARIDFREPKLPVKVSLEAFSPFIPGDAEESGLPVAFLRYRVTNPGTVAADVAIAWSIDNPVGFNAPEPGKNARVNELRDDGALHGLMMTNPGLEAKDVLKGSFALAALGDAEVSRWKGWPRGRWWNSPMLFWDEFSGNGRVGEESGERNSVGVVCIRREIAPGASADFTFVLAWHFPNRTTKRCGWSTSKGYEDFVIGNHYAVRFPDAWAAARYGAENLDALERRTKQFVAAIRESTLPPAVKDGAMSNLSTLVSPTCFRTADGEFHGFEGCSDKSGCCHGNCTHVWNYETATNFLFPSLARSLRRASFGYSMDDMGAIHFRQSLPEGTGRSGYAAADGQMGQIIHCYMDWILSGDGEYLKWAWPRAKKALEFAWVPGGWDANQDGVMEGVQHNTYDVEFYGPNPLCSVYYLGALRSGEEMALAMGDKESAAKYRRLFESGQKWIDANLFNGEYYTQKVRGIPKVDIAKSLMSDMGSADTEKPEYQVGDGCLVDQLLGQSLAEVAGLGPLLNTANMQKTLSSIYKYNYRRTMEEHDSVQRIFVVNDEAALVVCDYGKGTRPHIPFPYYAEVFTGLEYSTAAHMIYAGMVDEGVECIDNTRRRYDGIRRNPWDEAECGHHYARAMAAWSGVLALSGFRYQGVRREVEVLPRTKAAKFRCFWSCGTGWGVFTSAPGAVEIKVEAGTLAVRTVRAKLGTTVKASAGGKALKADLKREGATTTATLAEEVTLRAGETLNLLG
jgi:non-lysosomal glucosylceramidase